jgi:hypothetical protein
MADRKSLGILGFLLGGVTAAVMLTAAMVVKQHLDGHLSLDSRLPVMAAYAPPLVR